MEWCTPVEWVQYSHLVRILFDFECTSSVCDVKCFSDHSQPTNFSKCNNGKKKKKKQMSLMVQSKYQFNWKKKHQQGFYYQLCVNTSASSHLGSLMPIVFKWFGWLSPPSISLWTFSGSSSPGLFGNQFPSHSRPIPSCIIHINYLLFFFDFTWKMKIGNEIYFFCLFFLSRFDDE